MAEQPPMQLQGVESMGGFDPVVAAAQQQQQQQLLPPHLMQQQGQPLPHSASLYVGDLALDVTEALLFDIFNAVGPVASIRVCRDTVTRRSLGYAYVNFNNQSDAERALDTMNYTPIKGQPCRMMWSHRDPSLRKTGAGNVYVKNLDPSIDNKALYDTFSLFGDILSCKVVTDRNGQSKGYGFVHFETGEAAEEAISKINGMLISGREVYVGKFIKMSERPGATDWTNVYVKSIPLHWTKERLEDEFSTCGPIASATIMADEQGNSKGFGFVDFTEHSSAVKACETLNEKVVLTKLGEETGIEEDEEDEDEENSGEATQAPAATGDKTPVAATASESNAEKKTSAKKEEETGKSEEESDSEEPAEKKESKENDEAAVATTPSKPTKTQILYVTRAQKKHERERELTQKYEQIKLERINKFQGVNVFIKNLAEEVDEDLLRREFSAFGAITSTRVMRDNSSFASGSSASGSSATGMDDKSISKGFGFVCFSSTEEATKAVTEMNGKMLAGKPLYVALAQRKDARRAQLEQHHNQRAVGMGRGLGPMQAPMYAGAPLYFQSGLGAPGAAAPMMPGAAMRGMGSLAYFQGPMMAPQMTGIPNGAGGSRGGGALGVQGMGLQMSMMPRGMGAPMVTSAYGSRPGAFPPGGLMYSPQPQQIGLGGMGMMAGPVAGQAGRAPRRTGRQNTGRQTRVPGAPMGVGGMPLVMQGMGGQRMPQQMGGGRYLQSMPEAPMMSAPEPLTAAALANATGEQQKNMIGERLYPLIASTHAQLAGKITGMLLEMDNPELLNLIESPDALRDKIDEALHVLEAHQATVGGGEE